MPGSGKSSLGKELAKALHLQYVDLDHEIEVSEGAAIKDIFASKGEDYFREKEREALHRSIKGDEQLISTGGGAPCFFDNMDVINSSGISIYLKVSVNAIAERMLQKARRLDKRPLIASDNYEDLVEELGAKLAQRDKYYRQAQVIVEGDKLSYENVLEELKKIQ